MSPTPEQSITDLFKKITDEAASKSKIASLHRQAAEAWEKGQYESYQDLSSKAVTEAEPLTLLQTLRNELVATTRRVLGQSELSNRDFKVRIYGEGEFAPEEIKQLAPRRERSKPSAVEKKTVQKTEITPSLLQGNPAVEIRVAGLFLSEERMARVQQVLPDAIHAAGFEDQDDMKASLLTSKEKAARRREYKPISEKEGEKADQLIDAGITRLARRPLTGWHTLGDGENVGLRTTFRLFSATPADRRPDLKNAICAPLEVKLDQNGFVMPKK